VSYDPPVEILRKVEALEGEIAKGIKELKGLLK
jgi:hypothetical protein